MDSLVQNKKRELEDVKRRIHNLADRIADLPAEVEADSLLARLKEYEEKRAEVTQALKQLIDENSASDGNLIDMEAAFRMMQFVNRGLVVVGL